MLPDTSALLLFCAASLVLLVTPGPAVFYILARSLDQGRRAGLVSTLGIHLGTLVHILAAVLGISAVIVSSALAFSVLKYAGAAYLIYLGVRTWLNHRGRAAPAVAPLPTRRLSRLFYEGALVNVLNPKTALFFLAFLPQFVDPSRGHVTTQLAFLGLVFALLGLVSDGIYALAAGSVRGLLGRGNGVGRAQRLLTGGVYVGLGVTAALAEPPRR